MVSLGRFGSACSVADQAPTSADSEPPSLLGASVEILAQAKFQGVIRQMMTSTGFFLLAASLRTACPWLSPSNATAVNTVGGRLHEEFTQKKQKLTNGPLVARSVCSDFHLPTHHCIRRSANDHYSYQKTPPPRGGDRYRNGTPAPSVDLYALVHPRNQRREARVLDGRRTAFDDCGGSSRVCRQNDGCVRATVSPLTKLDLPSCDAASKRRRDLDTDLTQFNRSCSHGGTKNSQGQPALPRVSWPRTSITLLQSGLRL